jgi:hypothetical protein
MLVATPSHLIRNSEKKWNTKQITQRNYTNEVWRVLEEREESDRCFTDLGSRLKECNDPESWSLLIVKAVIDNLKYHWSFHGRYGTPETSIIKILSWAIPRDKVYIKILGIKLWILQHLLWSSNLTSLHQERINNLINQLEHIYTPQ